ncbi:alpha-N-acetylgalactosamine-specific lectin-like [Patiria miniata]|uniref:C-type lectin n=1 Tax=Patiria miniata TaxID=46514 RepID=A0A914AYF3_PATMI|nr:alpha-N-acetylgalactosamine-specific lectin-like [Patiria miniata]
MKLIWLNAIVCACFYAEACKPGQQRFGGSCYQLLNESMTWDQGDAACSEMGAVLAVPDSLEEHQFIWEMFTGIVTVGNLWIGCNDREEEGKWMKSSEGGECNFFDWAPAEPSGGYSHINCMHLWRYENGLMDDDVCSVPRSVICESPAPLAMPTMSCLQRYTDTRSSSHCLTGHVMEEFSAKGVITCGSACRDEPRCRSFNLRRGGPGELICQLNNITRNEADVKNIRLDNGCKYFNF